MGFFLKNHVNAKRDGGFNILQKGMHKLGGGGGKYQVINPNLTRNLSHSPYMGQNVNFILHLFIRGAFNDHTQNKYTI